MASTTDSLPDDVETLKAMLVAARAENVAAEVKAATAIAEASLAEALIAHQKRLIEKMRR